MSAETRSSEFSNEFVILRSPISSLCHYAYFPYSDHLKKEPALCGTGCWRELSVLLFFRLRRPMVRERRRSKVDGPAGLGVGGREPEQREHRQRQTNAHLHFTFRQCEKKSRFKACGEAYFYTRGPKFG
jgi:hypothetical protein